MSKYLHSLIISGCLGVFLGGCASNPSDAPPEQATTDPAETAPAATALPPPPEPEPAPVRPFEAETLYALLVAEIAGSRERYDIALGNYVEEAHRTRDPGITARATRIARLLGARQAALKTSLLWVELEPNNPEALYIAATELSQSGRLTEAFDYSEQLQRMGSTPMFESIAALAARATDTQREQLLQDFNRLLTDYPTDAQLLIGKSMLLQQDGKPEQALAVVRDALAMDPADIQAALVEARLLYQLGERDNALTRLEQLLADNPKNQRLRMQYARLLADYDLAAAQEQFGILVNQSPGDPDYLFSLALVAFQRGDYDTATESFQSLINQDEYASSAHYHLGQIAEAQQQPQAALEHYLATSDSRDVLAAASQVLDIYLQRDELLSARNHMAELRDQYDSRAIELYTLEAQALARHNYIEEALALLSRALNDNPQQTDLLYTRALINAEQDQVAAAEQDFRTIIKYQPNNANALNALGYTLADQTNRYQEARELVEKALSIEPDDPAIKDSMGWVLYQLGEYQKAIEYLREALADYPDHEVAAHLGEALWADGQQEEARQVWREGLERTPGSDLITEAWERMTGEAVDSAPTE